MAYFNEDNVTEQMCIAVAKAAQEVKMVQNASSIHSKDVADNYDGSRIWMAAESDEDN